MNKILQSHIYYFILLLFLLSSEESVCRVIDTPHIIAGTSKITGKITIPDDKNMDNIFVDITISQPISGEFVKYKALADRLGKFSIDVDVETNISFCSLNVSLNPDKLLLLKLISGGITNIDIIYNSSFNINNIEVTPEMYQNDVTQSFEVMNKMLVYRSGRKPEPLYNQSTNYFLNYARNILSERLVIANSNPYLSEESKKVLTIDYRLFLYKGFVLNYEKYMKFNYENTDGDKNIKPNILKIDRTYYRFLKDFNLNDPQYLNCFTFQEFQKDILQNEILAFPLIAEIKIPSWLASVKVILSDLVGFDDGPYYDILAANAYARQLNEEARPLTENQKRNIRSYWKNGEIAKILFRKNQKVEASYKFASHTVVNEISSVPNDKVIETIVSKYKNKVIFIDLWATWCAPCLEAMKDFKNTKGDFLNKDVKFVYLTNPSSPRKLWEEKIKGIGNEHYYLQWDQWESIMEHFGFDAIPSYLLYNKEGVLMKKFTSFPGKEEVEEMINRLL